MIGITIAAYLSAQPIRNALNSSTTSSPAPQIVSQDESDEAWLDCKWNEKDITTMWSGLTNTEDTTQQSVYVYSGRSGKVFYYDAKTMALYDEVVDIRPNDIQLTTKDIDIGNWKYYENVSINRKTLKIFVTGFGESNVPQAYLVKSRSVLGDGECNISAPMPIAPNKF